MQRLTSCAAPLLYRSLSLSLPAPPLFLPRALADGAQPWRPVASAPHAHFPAPPPPLLLRELRQRACVVAADGETRYPTAET